MTRHTMMTSFSGFLYCLSFNVPASRSYCSSSFTRTESTVKVLVALSVSGFTRLEEDDLLQGAFLD